MATTYTDQLVVVHSGSIKKVASDDSLILSGNLELGPAATLTIQNTGSIQHLNVLENLDVTGNAVVAGDLTVNGTTTTVNTTNLLVSDKLITLNDGGAAASGGASGIEIEEDGSATGFFKVAADRAGWELQAPGNNNTLTIDATDSKTLTIGGNLTISADTTISSFGAELVNDANAAAARTTLELVIGTDVQAYDAELAAIAGLTSAANKVPMFSDSETATLIDFLDEDNMITDSDTAVASQQSIKAYVASQVNAGSVASAEGVLSGSDVVLQSTNGSIELVAPNGVGQEYTGIYLDSDFPSGEVLSGSIVAISNTEGHEGYLEPANRGSHSHVAGVLTRDGEALVGMQLNPTASMMVHTLPGIQVPVLFTSDPSASTDQGKFCYLDAFGVGTSGRATLTVPESGNIIRLGVLVSTASDGGLYKVLWQPQFIADLGS